MTLRATRTRPALRLILERATRPKVQFQTQFAAYWYLACMSEQEEALEHLSKAGVLDGIRWAWASTCRRLAVDYDPQAGYNTAWLGYSAHTLLTDRLDRVFSCRSYAVHEPADVEVGLDVLVAGLLPGEDAELLRVQVGGVRRDNYNQSPGWRCGEWRWLLQAFPSGGIDKINWQEKSDTKKLVASQAASAPDNLFTDSTVEFSGEVPRSTLIIAHNYDGDTADTSLYLGSPKIDLNSGLPWSWRANLLDGHPEGGGRTRPHWPDLPFTPDSGSVPDAPVRLKPREGEKPQEGQR